MGRGTTGGWDAWPHSPPYTGGGGAGLKDPCPRPGLALLSQLSQKWAIMRKGIRLRGQIPGPGPKILTCLHITWSICWASESFGLTYKSGNMFICSHSAAGLSPEPPARDHTSPAPCACPGQRLGSRIQGKGPVGVMWCLTTSLAPEEPGGMPPPPTLSHEQTRGFIPYGLQTERREAPHSGPPPWQQRLQDGAGTLHADTGARARAHSGEKPQQFPPGAACTYSSPLSAWPFLGPSQTVLHCFYERVSPSLSVTRRSCAELVIGVTVNCSECQIFPLQNIRILFLSRCLILPQEV